MDHKAVTEWVEGYERAWRAAGTGGLDELFSARVQYVPSPWGTAVQGLDDLRRFWEANRDGPDEAFTMTHEVVALEGSTAVVRVAVDYHGADTTRWRDLWVLKFGGDGRCAVFEEWPFTPDQPDGH
ncbi:MAG: nuclear transport factor 2 family protein [Actinomycetota bacterium]|nr:nuclear transport factor 2 family protein [Actinomycetota bacterium]